jgi:hypothetical protein
MDQATEYTIIHQSSRPYYGSSKLHATTMTMMQKKKTKDE